MESPMNPSKAAKPQWTLAAPSSVLPAGIAENSAFLAQGFDEIGLAFFETEACLAYTEADLPPELANLSVSWHMHLPVDLPWGQGVARVAEVILALRGKAAVVSPACFVLHPPREAATLAELVRRLEAGGLPPERVLVENIGGHDLADLWPVIGAANLGVCLDLGHMIVHGQQAFLDLPDVFGRTRMLHLNAPDPEFPTRHVSLSRLDAAGLDLCRRLLEGFAPGGVVMLELFNKHDLSDSRRVFEALCAAEHDGPAE